MNKDIYMSLILGIFLAILFKYFFTPPIIIIEKDIDQI